MNQQQRKYAKERLENIRSRKIMLIRKKCSTPGKEITDEKRFTLLKQGKVKLRKDVTRILRRDDVIDVFDYSSYEHGETVDRARLEKESKLVSRKFNQAMDELMLGDSEKALKLIIDFEKQLGDE